MKRSSLFCAGIWPFLLVPLMLLAAVIFFLQHPIEEDVANNTYQGLNAIQADWAQVETYNRGRDVLLTGVAPNQQAAAAALDAASSAEGVRIAEFAGEIASSKQSETIALGSPKLASIVTGDSIVLRGTLADQAAMDGVVRDAEAAFGSGKVINKLSVEENLGKLPELPNFFSALRGKALGLGTLSADIENGEISLKGEVPDQSVKDSLVREIQALFNGKLNDNLSVATKVEADVCQYLVNELLASANINFQIGSSVIEASSSPLLAKLSSTARRCPDTRFEIAGHTDSTGSAEINQALSQQRAESVVLAMLNLGLNAEQFTAKGYGSSQSIADNSTAEGRAKNRRIEFKIKN